MGSTFAITSRRLGRYRAKLPRGGKIHLSPGHGPSTFFAGSDRARRDRQQARRERGRDEGQDRNAIRFARHRTRLAHPIW